MELMTLHNNIRDCNDLGVRNFSLGGLDEAFGFFQAALKRSKLLLRMAHSECRAAASSKLQVEDEHQPGRFVGACTKDCEAAFMDSFEDGTFMLEEESFEHTIVFLQIPSRHVSAQECVSICIFNFATFHYWKGINISNSSHDLRTAARYYEMVYKMQGLVDPQAETCIPTLLLATINNLGEIHAVEGDEPRSEICFEYLLKALVYFTYDEEPIQYCKRLKERFFERTMHLVLTDNKLAPAA
jgi:hypothetical protein